MEAIGGDNINNEGVLIVPRTSLSVGVGDSIRRYQEYACPPKIDRSPDDRDVVVRLSTEARRMIDHGIVPLGQPEIVYREPGYVHTPRLYVV